MQVLGKVRLNINIDITSRKEGKFETCFEFHVTEGLSHDVSLGMDFLELYNATIDVKNKKLTIEDNYTSVTVHKLITLNENIFNVEVVTANDICIPARSEMLLEGKLKVDIDNGKFGIFFPNFEENCIIAAHTVAVAHEGSITVRLLYPSSEERLVTCGAIVSTLEDLEEKSIYGENEFKNNTQSKTKVNNDLINDLDIGNDGTKQSEKERLKQLLYKYSNVFTRRT